MSVSPENSLLVDIGGTNFRSAIASIGSSEIQFAKKESLDCLKNFDEIIGGIISQYGPIEHAVFSVAGPKINNSISMTNREFHIDADEVKDKFNLKSCHLLNDWEAIGFSLHTTNPEEIQYIQQGQGFNNTSLMLGPGTGLGAAFISDNIVFPTEVGNTTFLFSKVFEGLELNGNTFDVLEDVLSGAGISFIHESLTNKKMTPEEVVSLATNKDPEALKAINIFIDALARILSDLALTYMPGKGIFMAGGLIRTLYSFIDQERFMSEFKDLRKPTHAHLLSRIPVGIIMREMTCLYGNLAFLNSQFKS
jgi:glucokinase